MKPNKISVFHMSGTEYTLKHMIKYNPYQIRGGVHGDVKYNRVKSKRKFQQAMKRGEL